MNIIDDLLGFYNATPPGDIYHDAIGHLMDNLTHIRSATIYQMPICAMCPQVRSAACAADLAAIILVRLRMRFFMFWIITMITTL